MNIINQTSVHYGIIKDEQMLISTSWEYFSIPSRRVILKDTAREGYVIANRFAALSSEPMQLLITGSLLFVQWYV